jgi:membrane-associated protein
MHLDKNLLLFVQSFGFFIYPLIFAIIFLETGIVITPILPGDSLLFAAGALASREILNIFLLLILVFFAAILGDNVNYFIGRYLGQKAMQLRWFKHKYLEKTHIFYEKYGNKTIILGRFVPIVRTFVPFVAGVGKMDYKRFLLFDIIANFIWVFLFLLAGFYFGNIPIVKDNFSLVILGIIIISVIPIVYSVVKEWFR